MIIFILCPLQVTGCYDTEAQLYRWAETTDSIWEHHHKEMDPRAYAEALVESVL